MPQAGSSSVFLNVNNVGMFSSVIPYSFADYPAGVVSELLKAAIHETTQWFIEKYMPLRFNASYARLRLGYVIANDTMRKKQRRARDVYPEAVLPNVWTGETRKIVQSTTPRTSRVGKIADLIVKSRIQPRMPGYVNLQRSQITNKVMKTITPQEAKRVAEVFFEKVASKMSSVQTVVKVRGKTFVSRANPAPAVRTTILTAR
jgi:hypothetical protein